MGVAGELQVEAGGLGRLGAARLVREQQAQRARGGLPASARAGSLALARSKWPALKSLTPATHQRRLAAPDRHMLVGEHREPEPAQLGHPGGGARVVLVVAGDEEGAFARTQVGERGDVRRELAHRAVDQVAGDRHQVGVEAR